MHDKVSELRKVAGEIESRREQVGIPSKAELCRKFVQLGHNKTYGRILNPKDDLTSGVDVDKRLEGYRVVLELLDAYKTDPNENAIYEDFEYMADALATIRDAMDQTDNTRLILITAGSGGGKTSMLDCMESLPQFANLVYRVEATEAWRERGRALVSAMLSEIVILRKGDGEKRPELPRSTDEQLQKVIEQIGGNRVIIAIDEGHHIGPEGYNIVKTVINQTRAVVVMTAMPDLLTRINKKSHAEAVQLFHNRLFAHIAIPRPDKADITDFLQRRGFKFENAQAENRVADAIEKNCATWGLWKFVKRFAREARKQNAMILSEARAVEIMRDVRRAITLNIL